MLFPVISAITSLMVLAVFLIPAYLIFGKQKSDDTGIVPYLLIFAYYLVSYFIIIFFNTGLMTCARIRMEGGDPKFMDGINNSMKHIGKIFTWALVSATVGIVLKIAEDKSKILGKIIIALIGTAWNLLTFFAVPIIIFEELSLADSIKKSGELFKKTWGENFISQVSIGIFFFLLGLLSIIPLIAAIVIGNTYLLIGTLILIVFYLIALSIVSSSLDVIFSIVLYTYASTGNIPAGFSQDIVQNSFKLKSS
ncbi:TPA: hypothetical protein ENS27_16140 [bacterium]|nr:hypothetical protein [bacterium]